MRSAGRASHSPCSTLLLAGVAEPPESPPALVRSYRTLSPLPVPPFREVIGGLLSVALPTGRPVLALASTMLCGVPTFLDGQNPPRPLGPLTVGPIRIGRSDRCDGPIGPIPHTDPARWRTIATGVGAWRGGANPKSFPSSAHGIRLNPYSAGPLAETAMCVIDPGAR